VLIVSVDGGCEGVRNVKSGVIAATSQQYPLKMAAMGVAAGVEYAKTARRPRATRHRRHADHRQADEPASTARTPSSALDSAGATSKRAQSPLKERFPREDSHMSAAPPRLRPPRRRSASSARRWQLGPLHRTAAGACIAFAPAERPLFFRRELLADPAAGDGGRRHRHRPDARHPHGRHRPVVRHGDGAGLGIVMTKLAVTSGMPAPLAILAASRCAAFG
jgi:hypothetical protein